MLFGPPGTGKTTLAHLLAKQSEKEIYRFNAVLGGVNDLKKLIHSALEMKKLYQMGSVIFIDEIHRFNKAQQDALLPYVESGAFTLIGATTENPRRIINNALLSRVQIVELKILKENEIYEILKDSAQQFNIPIDQKSLEFISDYAHGDARKAINTLEIIYQNIVNETPLNYQEIKNIVLENSNRLYDRSQNRHYDVISAFIKSLRGSDPDAAILWLAVMLDGGEDPVFIARRLVIFASEDVGNADPMGLTLATACLTAVQNIGMPEARINLAQATTYLASTVKSNASYTSINQALQFVKDHPNIEVPEHLKNHSAQKKNYLYPHDYEAHFIEQKYTTKNTPQFYIPSDQGHEKKIKERLKTLWRSKVYNE